MVLGLLFLEKKDPKVGKKKPKNNVEKKNPTKKPVEEVEKQSGFFSGIANVLSSGVATVSTAISTTASFISSNPAAADDDLLASKIIEIQIATLENVVDDIEKKVVSAIKVNIAEDIRNNRGNEESYDFLTELFNSFLAALNVQLISMYQILQKEDKKEIIKNAIENVSTVNKYMEEFSQIFNRDFKSKWSDSAEQKAYKGAQEILTQWEKVAWFTKVFDKKCENSAITKNNIVRTAMTEQEKVNSATKEFDETVTALDAKVKVAVTFETQSNYKIAESARLGLDGIYKEIDKKHDSYLRDKLNDIQNGLKILKGVVSTYDEISNSLNTAIQKIVEAKSYQYEEILKHFAGVTFGVVDNKENLRLDEKETIRLQETLTSLSSSEFNQVCLSKVEKLRKPLDIKSVKKICEEYESAITHLGDGEEGELGRRNKSREEVAQASIKQCSLPALQAVLKKNLVDLRIANRNLKTNECDVNSPVFQASVRVDTTIFLKDYAQIKFGNTVNPTTFIIAQDKKDQNAAFLKEGSEDSVDMDKVVTYFFKQQISKTAFEQFYQQGNDLVDSKSPYFMAFKAELEERWQKAELGFRDSSNKFKSDADFDEAKKIYRGVYKRYQFLIEMLERCKELEAGWKCDYLDEYTREKEKFNKNKEGFVQNKVKEHGLKNVKSIENNESEKDKIRDDWFNMEAGFLEKYPPTSVTLYHKLFIIEKIKWDIEYSLKNKEIDVNREKKPDSERVCHLLLTMLNADHAKKILNTHRGLPDKKGAAFWTWAVLTLGTYVVARYAKERITMWLTPTKSKKILRHAEKAPITAPGISPSSGN